jgi:ABC-2 type transport system permease protein
MHPRIVLAIARKDLFDAIKNMYLLFAVVLPIAMSLLFRVMFPSDSSTGGTSGLLDIAVYNPGQSQLVQNLIDTKQFSIYIVGSADEVKQRVQKDLLGGLVIPATFDVDVAAKKTPDLQVYFNAQRGGLRQMAFRQTVESALRDLAGQTTPARLVVSEVSGMGTSSFDLSGFYLLLFLVMSVTMVGVFVVPYILVEEKEKHTLKAVLASPASFTDVVIGKGLVGLFYAMLVSIILMAMNNGFVGNVAVTVLALLLGSVFLVLVGLLMGAAFKTLSMVNSWSSIVMIALMLPGMFGDFLAPPEPIPTIMRLVPTSYMARAITQAMGDTITASSAMLNLGALAISSALAFVAVIWFLRRERQ